MGISSVSGDRWQSAAQILRKGFAVKVLASHITWMLGDNEWNRPVWRERAVPPDGKTFDTPSFDQYLLMPLREGLDLPNLLTVHKLCEADWQHGVRAIQLMQREIASYSEIIEREYWPFRHAAKLAGIVQLRS